jgi:hypothetical protein
LAECTRWETQGRKETLISPVDYCFYMTKYVPLHTTYRHWGQRRYSSYSFLTSAQRDGEVVRVTSRPCLPQVPFRWEAEWDSVLVWKQRLDEKNLPCRRSNPGRPVRHQTLYWLTVTTYNFRLIYPRTWGTTEPARSARDVAQPTSGQTVALGL